MANTDRRPSRFEVLSVSEQRSPSSSSPSEAMSPSRSRKGILKNCSASDVNAATVSGFPSARQFSFPSPTQSLASLSTAADKWRFDHLNSIEFVLITVWLTTPGPGTPSTVCQPCSLTRPRAPGGNFTSTTWTWTWVLRKWRNVLCVLVLIVQWCGCLGLGGPGDGEAYRLHQPQVKWPRKYLYSILENVSRIDPAPLQLVEKCSLQKVHSQFSLLGMKIWKYIFYIFISEAWEVPMWRLLVDWLEL